MATISATRILPAWWMLAVLPSAAEPGTAERQGVPLIECGGPNR
jgi:hypothetical protein